MHSLTENIRLESIAEFICMLVLFVVALKIVIFRRSMDSSSYTLASFLNAPHDDNVLKMFKKIPSKS